MKIKTTKTMNLPQLIEHIVETSYECNKYIADNAQSSVYVGSIKGVVVEGTIFPTDTFTVEVEETVTEDTLFYHMIEITKNDSHLTCKHTNITEEKDSTSKEFHAYIDGEYRLIWRDGKLIEE